MNNLAGKVAIITGAGRGIGCGIALAFAEQGAKVSLCSRNGAQIETVAQEIRSAGGEALALAADVTVEENVERFFAATQEKFGRLDLLVNNAGAFDGGPLDELSADEWDQVIATNLRGPFLCTRAALRIMKRQQRGRIINIGSISAHRVRPGSAAYSASKHGLWGLTQVTAIEGREYGVTCSCIQPGNTLVERREASTSAEDTEPMMKIADLAAVVLAAASLPDGVSMLETTVLPRDQAYIGRG